MWVYLGSAAYMDYEEGYLPWQFANDDFIGLDFWQIYIFSTYWVCTVITTVGYGDYAGGTTLEYQVTLFLELTGIVVFATLQIAVNSIVNSGTSFASYFDEKEKQIDFWLLKLEKANFPYHFSGFQYMLLSRKTKESIRNDFNMIIEEYGFWELCTDKDKVWIVKVLFGYIIEELEPFFHGCE